MEDDALSRMIREKKGLPVNWRVYLFEAAGKDNAKKVRLTGALARPVTEFEPDERRPYVWLHPLTSKATMTIPLDEYRTLVNKP